MAEERPPPSLREAVESRKRRRIVEGTEKLYKLYQRKFHIWLKNHEDVQFRQYVEGLEDGDVDVESMCEQDADGDIFLQYLEHVAAPKNGKRIGVGISSLRGNRAAFSHYFRTKKVSMPKSMSNAIEDWMAGAARDFNKEKQV